MPTLSDGPRLTKRTVDAAKPGDRERFLWDPDLRGFGLRVFPSGRKTYVVQYRTGNRTRRLTLGAHGPLTPDEARALAQGHLGDVSKGGDPSKERQETRHLPTVGGLADRYLEQHARPKKKASSVKADESLLRLYVRPALGALRLDAAGRADVTALHHSLKDRPYQANRVLALLSKMFNLAERWGLRPDGSNPCRHVERYREEKRERFLSAAELQRLGAALAEAERDGSEHPSAVIALRLLALTGLRMREVLTLRWDAVDFEKGRLYLADTKTGKRTVPVGGAALQALAEAPRAEGNHYVCPGDKEGHHLVGLTHIWYRLRERAGLADVRTHDLRHSFASVGAGSGLALPILGALLGHTQPQTTSRYAHLADDPLKQAAERISGEIAAAMGGDGGDSPARIQALRR